MKKETIIAMEAVEALLAGGMHTVSSCAGAARMTDAPAHQLLTKMEALDVLELFEVTHRSAGLRRKMKVARKGKLTLKEALGQQLLDLGGNVCLPKEQERAMNTLRKLVLKRFPMTKAVKETAWPATKLRWYRVLKLMAEKDGAEWSDQLQVLTWLFESKSRDAKFWGGQIRSADALRKHFAMAHSKMIGDGPSTTIDEDWEV